MDAAHWQRVKDLFSSALERLPAEREAFLAEACASDPELREQVQSLLSEHEHLAAGAESSPGEPSSSDPSRPEQPSSSERDPVSGRRLGAYRVLRRVGRGGMATVYLAVRADDHYRKTVAIKMVPTALDNEALIRRFRNERQTLAALDHPHIVRLLDAGSTEDGLPFLVMDYVEGTRLDRYCDHHKLSVNERLLLFRKVCEAVSYAHQRLIIHRDLKPSNVLVTADGTPKLLDFGIAKLTNPEAAATLVLTGTGQRLMTPEYASPEQVRGEPLTNATDIYSLGVVLYELLTGQRPVRVKSRSLMDIERAICEEEPGKPSTIVTRRFELINAEGKSIALTPEEVSRTREGDPRKLSKKLHGDLDAIVMMALRKEPQRRYSSVYEFSEDVRRYLDGLPIKARPNTIVYRGTKFLQRHKEATVALGAVVIVMSALAFGMMLYSRRAQTRPSHGTSPGTPPLPLASTASSAAAKYGWKETDLPDEVFAPDLLTVGAAYTSPQLELFRQSSFGTWDPAQPARSSQTIGFPIVGRADCGTEVWLVHDDRRHFTKWDITKQQALKTITVPWVTESAACLDEKDERWAFLVADPQSSRLIEFDAVTNKTLDSTQLAKSFFDVAFDDQAHNLVLIGENDISVRTRDHLAEVFHDKPEEALFHAVRRWSPSGRYLALGFKQLLVYDVELKRRINTLGAKGWLNDVGWVGDQGLSAMDDRGRLYWTSDLTKGWELTQEPATKNIYREFWDATNLRWVSAQKSGKISVLNYTSPSALFSIPINTLDTWSIASDPANATVAVTGKDPRIQIVDLQQQKIVQTLEGHTDGVTFARFNPQVGLISASDDATLRTWDPAAGKLLQTIPAHRSLINAFAISPNGKWLISVSSDKTIKLWDLPGMTFEKDLGTTRNSGAAAAFLIGDDSHFLVSDWDGWLYLYYGDAPNWQLQHKFQLSTEPIYMVCPTPSGWWATLFAGSKAGLWSIPVNDLQHATQLSRISTQYCSSSDDGQMTAVLNAIGIQLRSNTTGQQVVAYYFANDAATVAIHQHPSAVLTEIDGKLVGWPLPARH